MSPDRAERIETAIAEAEARGERWTIIGLARECRIGHNQVAAYLRQRQAVPDVRPLPRDPAPREALATVPLCPLLAAKAAYTQALEAVAQEQAVTPTTRAARAAHLERLTRMQQIFGQAAARWSTLQLAAQTALARLQHARASRGRGSRPQQAHVQAQGAHAQAQLQQLLATTQEEAALVELTLDALKEPLIAGRRLLGGLVG